MGEPTTAIIDCYSVIHMHLAAVSSDACVSARATIRAAEIQAKATRSSGSDTLIAALIALLAGFITLCSAMVEHRRQRKLSKFRERVFVSKLFPLLGHAKSALHDMEFLAQEIINGKSINSNEFYPSKIAINSYNVSRVREFLSFDLLSRLDMIRKPVLDILSDIDARVGGVLDCYNILVKYRDMPERSSDHNISESELIADITNSFIIEDCCNSIKSHVSKINSYESQLSRFYGLDSYTRADEKALLNQQDFNPPKPQPPA